MSIEKTLTQSLNMSLETPLSNLEPIRLSLESLELTSAHKQILEHFTKVGVPAENWTDWLFNFFDGDEDTADQVHDDFDENGLIWTEEEEPFAPEFRPFVLFGSLPEFSPGHQGEPPLGTRYRAWTAGDIPLGFWIPREGTPADPDELTLFKLACLANAELEGLSMHDVDIDILQ